LKKKKILIVTECFYPEEFKINDIALAWKEKGYQVDILTMVPSYPQSIIYDGFKNKFYQKNVWNDINIYRVKAVTGYKNSLFKKLLKYFTFMITGSIVSLFIGKKYDYVFGFNMSALTGMMPAILIKKVYKKPVIFWAQDLWPDSVYAYGFKKTKLLSYILDKFVKFMYHNIDNIAISGKGFESKLEPYVKKDLIFHYVPNWADNLNMDVEAFIFNKEKRVQFTFAGNIGKVQNLENIIKAFLGLPVEEQNKAQLNIIGDGSHLEIIKQIAQNNQNIIFHGKKPRDEMSKYYKGSDFLIVSLIDEPIFNVTIPAKTQTYIAAKKPILAIISGDTAKLIKDNHLGFCASPNNIKDIKQTFLTALSVNESEINKFTTNCDFLTQTIFNKEKTIQLLEDIMIGNK
jgi:glycosyltransferase involved in cell wall biosynthesis